MGCGCKERRNAIVRYLKKLKNLPHARVVNMEDPEKLKQEMQELDAQLLAEGELTEDDLYDG